LTPHLHAYDFDFRGVFQELPEPNKACLVGDVTWGAFSCAGACRPWCSSSLAC